jgi:ribosomal protein S18 acetylase RimI-like enzyme
MQQVSPDIRKALPGEANALAALAESLFRQSYGPTHPEPELSRYVARTFSNEIFARYLSDPRAIVLVTEDGPAGPLIGYAVLRDGSPVNEQLAEDESEPIEIVRFYVDPRWHGSGVAQALMTECIVEAERRGRNVIWLQAWQEAGRALAFYRKLGFVVRGTAKFEFGDRMDDDFLLVRPIAGRSVHTGHAS